MQVECGEGGDNDVSRANGGSLGEIQRTAADFQAGVISAQQGRLRYEAGSNPGAARLNTEGGGAGQKAPQRQQEDRRGAPLLVNRNQADGEKEVEPDQKTVLIQKRSKALSWSQS